MALNGIDISNYQRGLDLARVPCDFVICKATEGTSITHSTCEPWVQQAARLGKLWGFYHFLNKENPIKQADYFVRTCRGYFGHGVPVLDYEMYGRIGTDGAKRFLDRVFQLTGIRCVVYTSRSVLTEEDWSAIAPNHALWVAQYASDKETGYQESPWLPGGGFGAWKVPSIHQYSSNGRLEGYKGALDLDIAYMTRDGWSRLAGGGAPAEPMPPASPSGTDAELAAAVMRGEHGDGEDRKARLGSRYAGVQAIVNRVSTASAEDLAADVLAGRYGNGDTRRAVLGARYAEVQAIVNGGYSTVYTVRRGDTLSAIARRFGTTVQEIVSRNGIRDPNRITVGLRIKV